MTNVISNERYMRYHHTMRDQTKITNCIGGWAAPRRAGHAGHRRLDGGREQGLQLLRLRLVPFPGCFQKNRPMFWF